MSRLLPDDGRVAIAVATTGTTPDACCAQARAAVGVGADVIELRADLLAAGPGSPCAAGPTGLADLAGELSAQSGGARVLVTVRTAAEGGGARLDDDAYRTLVRSLAGSLGALDDDARPAALDVESARGWTAGLVAAAHEAGLEAVVSRHDTAATPGDSVMLEGLRAMAGAGADVAKLAVMPRSARDVARLLAVTAQASEELGLPVVTMSMGALGAVSRVSGTVFGSALTFATVDGDPSAPGQLPIEQVRAGLRLLSARLE